MCVSVPQLVVERPSAMLFPWLQHYWTVLSARYVSMEGVLVSEVTGQSGVRYVEW